MRQALRGVRFETTISLRPWPVNRLGKKPTPAPEKRREKKMIETIAVAGRVILMVVLASAWLFGQGARDHPDSSPGLEFPVVMRQKVTAGKTAVGTKIQAKLTVATLVKGVVIPQDAILSGEVIESVAKSDSEPSRLSIRMDSAQWKNGSLPINVYLTAWYYPILSPTAGDLSDRQSDAGRGWGGTGSYPNPNARPAQTFPGAGNNAGIAPPAPESTIAKHRVLMKDIESTRSNKDGAVILSATHFNIKLDKQTTYVLATGDLAAGPS